MLEPSTEPSCTNCSVLKTKLILAKSEFELLDMSRKVGAELWASFPPSSSARLVVAIDLAMETSLLPLSRPNQYARKDNYAFTDAATACFPKFPAVSMNL